MSLSTGPITVTIPCLNAERTLADALDTVFRQTVPPAEVLLVDDGSTDRSVEIARSFGPRVRVLRNPRRSTGPARRLGVQEARTEFVAFMDADDLIETAKHERQLHALESSPRETLVHTASVVFHDDGSKPDYVRRGSALAAGRDCTQIIFERNPVCGASVMMRRSVALEIGSYDDDLRGTDDYCLSLVASTCCNFAHVDEPLYRMRRHGGQMTAQRASMVYMHWLAQEKFRQRCPAAFAALPSESVQQFMIDPVVRMAKEAYCQRDERDYLQVLCLARRLAPEDADLARLWRRRWLPMSALRTWDRIQRMTGLAPAVET